MTSADMARAASNHRNESPRGCTAKTAAWGKTKVNSGSALASASLKRCAGLLAHGHARRRERAFLATLNDREVRNRALSRAIRWHVGNKAVWQARKRDSRRRSERG